MNNQYRISLLLGASGHHGSRWIAASLLLSIMMVPCIAIIGCKSEKKGKTDNPERPQIESKNGYKQFTWGQSVEEIKGMVSDIGEMDSQHSPETLKMKMTLANAFTYFDADIAQADTRGIYTTYRSQENKLVFGFRDARLLAVQVNFYNVAVFEELERKYGRKQREIFTKGPNSWEVAVWDEDPQRVIAWDETGGRFAEHVTYIDGAWFQKVRDQISTRRHKKESSQRSRLD